MLIKSDKDVTGLQFIDLDETHTTHQVSLTGSGQVSIYVWVPGEVNKDGIAAANGFIGRAPIADNVIDLDAHAGTPPPRLFGGFVDAIELVGTGTYSYKIVGA